MTSCDLSGRRAGRNARGMNRGRLLRLVGLLTLAPVLAGPAAVADPVAATAPSVERAALNQRVFDRVWNEVRRNYYDPRLHGVDWEAARRTYRPQAVAATDERALYRVLNRMLELLDDGHAAASSPAAVRRDALKHEERAVMGMTLVMQDHDPDHWRIERIRPGSPAEAAGLQVGWVLDSVDGEPWGPEAVVEDGRPVRLRLTDETGALRQVGLTPRIMPAPDYFSADRSRPGVLVLRIDAFDEGLGQWMGRQLEGLPAGTDVVLDLRSNPGGRLDEAEAVLTCFLPRGQPWATRTGRNGRAVTLRTLGDCGGRIRPATNDLAVLVDDGSRSAAELTPAALQEAGRAVVVGETTGGSVLIAQDTDLPDGGRLTLSRADFVTRRGVRLEKRGVTPDIAAPRTLAERRAGEDPALETAVRALSEEAQTARTRAATAQ